MTDITSIFFAGLTQRWHTNPWLASSCDRIDGHQGRVARLCIALWPDASRDLIIAALTHDDGESITGDIPAIRPKTKDQEHDEKTARAKVWNAKLPILTIQDQQRLRFCDKLDAAMWMLHHAPECKHQQDWKDAIKWLDGEASRLGVEDQI